MSNIGQIGRIQFTPHPVRLAIFNSVPAWRRLRHLHQVPDLPGEFLLTYIRVSKTRRQSQLINSLMLNGIISTPKRHTA
ncbi:hypothetical protein [Enterobacter soli]|uniref:hypothetical protein n=1 Tax=Enterobacter soli TaxID=885040 RepID=UPI002F3FDD82